MNDEFEKQYSVIRGDLFSASVIIEGINEDAAEHVKKVWFSSRRLGVREELEHIGGKWLLRIPGEVTKSFPLEEATFDITVEFSDGSYYTAKYGGMLIVKEKINGVTDDE